MVGAIASKSSAVNGRILQIAFDLATRTLRPIVLNVALA
jgi:hypothetical protein